MSKTAQLIHDVEEEKKSKKKGFATLLVSGVLAASLCMGGVMAYLTATDSATNNFTVAEKLAIEVVEPNWDPTDADNNGVPDAAEDVLPGQTVSKDPQIKNLTSVESYAIMQVDVPTKTVQLEGEDAAAQHELFTYTVNAGWTEQGTGTYNAETGMTTHTYFYDTTLAGNATSTAVFDDVTLVNLADGQMAGALAQSIDVTGYAIQALGFNDCGAAWTAYQAQNA